MVSVNSDLKKKVVLFVHYGDEWIRGSEHCLLNLLKHLDYEQFVPVVWCNATTMEREVKALNVAVVKSEFNILFGWKKPHLSIVSFLKQVKKGIDLIKQFDVDVVHVNSGAPNQWMLPAAYFCDCPLITHLHSPYIFRDRLSLGLYQSPMVVGVSRAVIHDFIQDDMSSGEIKVIHNGIDIDRLQSLKPVEIKSKLGLSKSDFLLATVGSLIYRKGIDLIISAVHDLLEKGIPVYLVVIGEGPEGEVFREQVDDLSLQEHIFFLGEYDRPQELLLGDVDVVVSAAREEAFGLVLAEAGLAKLPVIAPNIGGIPEVVVDNYTGLLFDSEDVHGLSSAVADLYWHPDKLKTMGDAAYLRICKYFSIQENANRISNIYSSSIRKHKSLSAGNSVSLFTKKIVSIKKIFSFNLVKNIIRRIIKINWSIQNDNA